MVSIGLYYIPQHYSTLLSKLSETRYLLTVVRLFGFLVYLQTRFKWSWKSSHFQLQTPEERSSLTFLIIWIFNQAKLKIESSVHYRKLCVRMAYWNRIMSLWLPSVQFFSHFLQGFEFFFFCLKFAIDYLRVCLDFIYATLVSDVIVTEWQITWMQKYF